MKKVKMLLIGIVSLFIGVIPVLADASKFETKINMEPEITENQINLILGFRGEEVMAVSETITYDATRVTLLDIISIDNFTVTMGAESIDGKWHTISFLADSMYSFTDTNYAIVVFEVKDNFKINKDSDIFLYNIEASGPDKIKFRDRGNYVTLTRESVTNMYMSVDSIKDGAKLRYYLKKYLLLGIVSFIAVVAVIVIIIICLPSFKKKENRTKQVNKSIESESYKPDDKNMQPIKINQDELERMNENKKVINLSEAIVVSDDVKPFEENTNKEEIVGKVEANKEIEVPFDPFNVTLEDMEKIRAEEEKAKKSEVVETELPAKKQDPLKNEMKAPILTMDFSDDVNEISLDDNEDDEDNDNSDDSNSNNMMNSILLLLAISLVSLFSFSVNALEEGEIPPVSTDIPAISDSKPVAEETTKYRVDDLRDCIVGNIPFDSALDYNEDGVVDVLDIVYTRNTINVNFEELLQTEPGFKELHGQSPNILGGNVTTTKVIVDKNKTTSRRTIVGGNSATKKTTTNKSQTTKSTTSRTTKSTTSKTTKKTTIDLPIDDNITYQVNVNAKNGLVNNSSTATVNSGKNATFVVIPNTGYAYSSVSCTNGVRATYSRTDRTLKVATVKSNTTCTVEFEPRKDIKVSVNATNGSASPKSSTVTLGSTVQFTVNPHSGYAYVPNSLSCTNGVSASYSGNTLTVSNVTNDTTCSLSFSLQSYTVRVYVNNQLVGTESVPYNGTYQGYLNAPSNRGSLKCNGTSVSATKTKITDTMYTWAFTRKVTGDMTCYLTTE